MPGDENRVRSEPKTSFRFKSVKQASEEMKEKSTGKKRSWKNAKQILAAEMYEVYPLTQPSCKVRISLMEKFNY